MAKIDNISSFCLLSSSSQSNHQAEETGLFSSLFINYAISTPIDPKHRFQTSGDTEEHIAINSLDQFLLFHLP